VSATEPGLLAIDGELTVDSVPRRWPQLLAQADGVQTIDLAGVTAIDSAGLALIQALRAAAARLTGQRPLLRQPPARMRALCVAHRVEIDGH
jgi:ABC-type transporter Mla MlaB component